jgi:hypothetical protein
MLVGGCGWLPADRPAVPPTPPAPDAALFHDWKVTGHVLGARALISDYDAAEFDGRSVVISDTSYVSPWSGSCGQAGRQKTTRVAAEIAIEHDIAASHADRLGLGPSIVEYRITCATGSAPGLTLYLGGAHAVTCFTGVCYLLGR